MNALIAALHSGRVLLMDGPMGTELQRLTRSTTLGGYETYNRTRPDLVRSVHRAYHEAGAVVVLTNTFQADPASLARQGIGEQYQVLWQSALQLARAAIPDSGFVLADVGPLATFSRSLALDIIPACQGADGILLETWSSLDALQQFADALDTTGGEALPLLVSFTFYRDDRDQALKTIEGVSPEDCASCAQRAGAIALGANCGKDIDMHAMHELIVRYRTASDLPLFVRPNAGTPTLSGTGWQFPHTPEIMAQALPPLLDAGIAMVGGCCGTTPATIQAFRAVINDWNQAKELSSVPRKPVGDG